MASRLQDVIQRGTAALRPLATAVAPGTLYYSTDTSVTERSNGTIWEAYSGSGGGGGALPTDTVGKVLISQGSGVTPIFSNTVQFIEQTFASLPVSPPIGTLANISDAINSYIGQFVTGGGGTGKVLIQWTGTNWLIIAQRAGSGFQCDSITTIGSLSTVQYVHVQTWIRMIEMPFASIGASGVTSHIGILLNVSDSTTNTPGAVVAGGGTFHILARWNGTNWIVIGG